MKNSTGWFYGLVGLLAAVSALVFTGCPTESEEKTYTVTWKNYDGTVLETDTGVAAGATPEYNGAPPAKPADSANTYAFSGWNPAPAPVTADTAYTAQFTATPKTADEIAHDTAVAEKQQFDNWIDQPERKAIILPGVLEPTLTPEQRQNTKTLDYPNGFPLSYFETPHTFEDAKQDLSERSTPIVKAPAPKDNFLANQNRMANAGALGVIVARA